MVGVLAVGAVVPLSLTRHPPIQDWPQHLAAVRVLHSYSEPELGFQKFFELAPGDTQYLTVYYATHALAHLLDVRAALAVVLGVSLAALPLAIGALSRALGRSAAIGALVLPLLYGAQTVLGFINFMAALPLALVALALCVQQRHAPSRARPWTIALVLGVCFYTHVVPFALAVAGAGLIALEWPRAGAIIPALRRMAARLAPLLGAGLLALPWLFTSPAGRAVLAAAGLVREAEGARPMYPEPRRAWDELPLWLNDVWTGEWDRRVLHAWVALALTWAVLGVVGAVLAKRPPTKLEASSAEASDHEAERRGDRSGAHGHGSSAEAQPRHLVWRLAVLPLACVAGYFYAPESYGWIWPINTRFALLAIVLALPLIGAPPRHLVHVLGLAASALAIYSLVQVGKAFLRFEGELGDIDAAVEQIPPGEKVAGLIWSRHSRVVGFAPYLHSVAYYQAARGGAVMFTFADFPQSPFHFVEDERPPRVPPRWEWTPERVAPDRDLDWYDWILTRGGPQRLRRAREFERVFESGPWRVWRRSARPAAERPAPGSVAACTSGVAPQLALISALQCSSEPCEACRAQ